MSVIGSRGPDLSDREGLATRLKDNASLAQLTLREAGSPIGVDDLAAKLSSNDQLGTDEVQALEAIVYQFERPIIPARYGQVEIKDRIGSEWPAFLANSQPILKNVLASVGQLSVTGHPTLSFVSTAFHIGNRLILTTRHVAEIFTEQETPAQYRFKAGLGATIDFRSEDSAIGMVFIVTAIVLVHPVLDVAILQVGTQTGWILPPAIMLDGNGEPEIGQRVAVIGYVGATASLTPSIWADPNPSRTVLVSPGQITGYENALIAGSNYWSVTHDCSTQPGFSGGPLIDLVTGHVLGLHIGSKPFGGYAVPTTEIARDSRIRDNGLTFTANTPPPDPFAWVSDWGDVDPVQPPPSPAQARPEELKAISRTLSKSYQDYSALVAFVAQQGPAYAKAIDAVPGGANLPLDQFRGSLLAALDRRGLLNASFKQALGLIDPDAVVEEGPSVDPGLAEAELDVPALIAQLCDTVDFDSLTAKRRASILLGSPHWARICGERKSPPPFRAVLTGLAGAPDEASHEVLVSVLRRLRVYHEGDPAEADISQVLRELGSPPQPIMIAPATEPEEMVPIAYFEAGLRVARSVGRLTPKDRSASSTCWLLTPDLVVAPAHFAATALHAKGGEETNAARRDEVVPQDYLVEFDGEAGLPAMVYAIKEMPFFDNGLDLMLLRLARTVTDRGVLQVRKEKLESGIVTSIHYPLAGAKMISLHGGRALSDDGHEMQYVLATAPGVGGAPVFDAQWRVAATHLARIAPNIAADAPAAHYKRGTSMTALVDAVRDDSNCRDLWREIVGSQERLRSVDAALVATAAIDDQTQIPVTIGLVDADTQLAEQPGLELISRFGEMATAMATRAAVRTLGLTQGVVSVSASVTPPASECNISVPHIGMLKLRSGWLADALPEETGDKALIAVIDSGIDVFHETFLDDGASAGAKMTRIEAFWDQQSNLAGISDPTHTFSQPAFDFVQRHKLKGGALYIAQDIDAMLLAGAPAPSLPPMQHLTHGTVVCSIAAGRQTGTGPSDFFGGVAPGARLTVIRFDPQGATVGYSFGHMQALDFIEALATEKDLPVVVNISNGMNSGAHDGQSDVERGCGSFTEGSGKPGRVIIKSAGNERRTGRHAEINVPNQQKKILRFRYAEQVDFNDVPETIELWMQRSHDYTFVLVPPSGEGVNLPQANGPVMIERLDNGNHVHATYNGYVPENGFPMLKLTLSAGDAPRIEKGDWQLHIVGASDKNREPIRAWIELSRNHGRMSMVFVDSVVSTCTITIPGTSRDVITVGGTTINDCLLPYDESSAGPTLDGREKPEIAAPGVAIRGAAAGMGAAVQNRGNDGTSLSAPHVAGVVALVLSARKKSGKAMLTSRQIRDLLIDKSKTYSGAYDPQSGFGELDAKAFYDACAALP